MGGLGLNGIHGDSVEEKWLMSRVTVRYANVVKGLVRNLNHMTWLNNGKNRNVKKRIIWL